MKVKSLKSNRKLIKGMVYDTLYFNNDPSTSNNNRHRWTGGRIEIEGYGYYKCRNFTTTDGKPLPEIIYDKKPEFKATTITDIKKGDIIVCKTEAKFKYLIRGGKYRIENIRIQKKGSGIYQYEVGSIKLQGYKRWLNWNAWSFRKLDTQEYRDLALSQIFDKEENFSVDFVRKFDQLKTPDKILIETIAKSILDPYRHELDIIDWGIEKNSQTYNLRREDFKHLLNIPVSELLDKFESLKKETV